jgi:hypothetical protein
MSPSWEYRWHQFFAASGAIGVLLCLIAWEALWPQPPDFDMSGVQTAQFYAEHQTGMLLGIVVTSIGLPFLMLWSLQLGSMLRRLEGGSALVSIAATVGVLTIDILLVFDLAVWAVAAYRPAETNPDVTRAFSDLGWISSMFIWPPLALGMALIGVVILKTQHKAGALPAWTGWISIVAAIAEPGQAGIIFAKSGVFAPDGLGSWYLAVFTWGPWILLLSIAQVRHLAKTRTSALDAGSEGVGSPQPQQA